MNQERGNKSGFRVVPDTTVVIADKLSQHEKSPNKEFFRRWFNKEFVLLYWEETRLEYAKKLREKGVDKEIVKDLLESIFSLGEEVEITYSYLPYVPEDRGDYRFVLCAKNGDATHIVSYDQHLLNLQGKFKFKIVKTVPFLKELRAKLKEK